MLGFPYDKARHHFAIAISDLSPFEDRAVETTSTQTKPATRLSARRTSCAGFKTPDLTLGSAGGLGLCSREFYSPRLGARYQAIAVCRETWDNLDIINPLSKH